MVLELKLLICLVELLVIVKMMLGWEDGKRWEEKRILIHTEVDNSVPRLLHGGEDQKG